MKYINVSLKEWGKLADSLLVLTSILRFFSLIRAANVSVDINK